MCLVLMLYELVPVDWLLNIVGLMMYDFNEWVHVKMRNVAQCTCCRLPRKGWCFALVVAIIIFIAGLKIYVNNTSYLWVRENTLEETLAIMQTRLKFLESQRDEKNEEIYYKQAKSERGYNQTQKETENDVSNATYSPELEELLRNMSGSKASDALSQTPERINVPFSLRLMPHLMENPYSLLPVYQMKSERTFADYIIGIPHVKRDKDTYLYGTLKFLVNNLSEDEIDTTTIVVMIGETDLKYIFKTAHRIARTFDHEVTVGLIEVIAPAVSYYPDLDALAPTLGDSQKRTRWRTKQNLDAIYLMAYAQPRCLYYLMLEDDVVASDGYMTEIRKFTAATTVSNPDWFFIQYSTTGGIGKLFRSTDLLHFITYIQLFYKNMPIDWLTESYLADRSCGINKGAKQCADAKTKIRPTYRKDLFKHVGLYSSLKGKIQKVKDTPKEKVAEFFPHENPPLLKIKNDIGNHDDYTIEKCYKGEDFFWGLNPKKDDVIEFWFQKPLTLGRYMIRSGNVGRTTDKIYNASIEVLSNKPGAIFTNIAHFDEFGLVEGHLSGYTHGDLLAIRIRFETASKYWVLITEIEFVPLKEELDKI